MINLTFLSEDRLHFVMGINKISLDRGLRYAKNYLKCIKADDAVFYYIYSGERFGLELNPNEFEKSVFEPIRKTLCISSDEKTVKN